MAGKMFRDGLIACMIDTFPKVQELATVQHHNGKMGNLRVVNLNVNDSAFWLQDIVQARPTRRVGDKASGPLD